MAFDIGCNAGAIAAYLGLAVGPQGRVLAFDPYPWNALATHYTARLNHLENVWAYTVGIGDRTFDLNLPLDAARTLDGQARGAKTIPARVVDILDFVDERPTFMKIDIEGAEWELSRTDWSRFDRLERVFLELHPFFIDDRGLDTRDVLRNFAKASFELRYGHPQAALADPESADPGHGGWWLSRASRGRGRGRLGACGQAGLWPQPDALGVYPRDCQDEGSRAPWRTASTSTQSASTMK